MKYIFNLDITTKKKASVKGFLIHFNFIIRDPLYYISFAFQLLHLPLSQATSEWETVWHA